MLLTVRIWQKNLLIIGDNAGAELIGQQYVAHWQ